MLSHARMRPVAQRGHHRRRDRLARVLFFIIVATHLIGHQAAPRAAGYLWPIRAAYATVILGSCLDAQAEFSKRYGFARPLTDEPLLWETCRVEEPQPCLHHWFTAAE
jgi:hypothetical protein